MKIVRLTDGLGNQLFQVAFAYALRKLTADEVLLDRSWFPEFGGKLRKATPRKFGLAPYSGITLPYAQPGQADKLIHGAGPMGAIRKLLHRRPGLLREGRADISPEALSSLKGDWAFRVFAQKALYSDMVRDELLAALTLPTDSLDAANRALAQEMQSRVSVAVHIRRGDYLKDGNIQVHGICSADYYARAEAHIRKEAGLSEPPHLYLFSDDPEWVRANYRTDSPFTVVDINDADHGHLDINLMAHCHHAITANSTFSWWGAWLNRNPDKVVATPAHWFADGRETPGLIPPSWHCL